MMYIATAQNGQSYALIQDGRVISAHATLKEAIRARAKLERPKPRAAK